MRGQKWGHCDRVLTVLVGTVISGQMEHGCHDRRSVRLGIRHGVSTNRSSATIEQKIKRILEIYKYSR